MGMQRRTLLGSKKAIDLVKAGANLRLQVKLDEMGYETSMRSWLTEPVDSESDDDYDDDDDDKERQPRGRCARGRWRGRGRRVVGACGRGGRTVNSSSYLAQIRRI